jgi:hypothetical protein
VGSTIGEARFLDRYGLAVAAVHRAGARLSSHIGKVRLRMFCEHASLHHDVRLCSTRRFFLMSQIDNQDEVVAVLNRLLEAELAGVVRYTHYSFLVFGFSRIPVVSWLREQANESLRHAEQVGEWITALGAFKTDDAIQPTLVATVVRFNNFLNMSGETQIIMTMPQE